MAAGFTSGRPAVPGGIEHVHRVYSGLSHCRDKHHCGSGSPEQGSRFCLAELLDSEATNPFEYEFSFQLEIRGPCLLAGRSTGAVLLHKADLSPPQGNVRTPPLQCKSVLAT